MPVTPEGLAFILLYGGPLTADERTAVLGRLGRAAEPRRRRRALLPSTASLPRPLIDESTVAAWVGTTMATLRNARCSRLGPLGMLPYTKIGRSVRYSPDDIEAFLRGRRREPEFAAQLQQAGREAR